MYSSWPIDSCRYYPVSLCFTNWLNPFSYSSLCLSCNLSQAKVITGGSKKPERWWIRNKKRSSVEERESIYAQRWEIEDKDNLVASQCASSRTWREMEDNGVSYKKLLMARSYEECREIYWGMWFMSKNEK